MNIATKCVHGSGKYLDHTGAVSVPIYQSATFMHPSVGESTGYDYSRVQNPTREHLEKTVCALEGGVDCIAFSSGMAAEAMLMELFSPGDHIIASDDLYGGTPRLFNKINAKNGLSFTFIDTGEVSGVKAAITPQTKAIFIETPTNPMMKVTDIAAIAEITKAHGLLLIVDNTFLTPYLQRPIALGADIVIHSGTKYLGGHNDTLAGFLVVNSEKLSEEIRFLYKTTGPCLAPFDSWLIMRGLKTLALRMKQQEQTSHTLAKWLGAHPSIERVYYCGRTDHPSYDISKKQADGFGAMISFRTKNAEIATKALERIRLIAYAESLGGVETLMTFPYLQTHADLSDDIRKKLGIDDCLLRLSVGIEDAEDLIADLQQALEA